MQPSISLGDLPAVLIAPLAALLVVQIIAQVWALIVLFRTPEQRLVFGKRWPWILIIVLLELIGPIVFFAAGRTPAPVADPNIEPTTDASSAGRAAHAADVLYGSRDKEDS